MKFEINPPKFWYSFLAWYKKRNSIHTPPIMIVAQMNESRPLPLNRPEWEAWSTRIISGAMLSADNDSQLFSLANMLLHLGPTESHKPDAFFIHSLRKFAVNQVADTIRKELHEAVKTRTAAAEAKAKDEVLSNPTV